MYISLIYLIIVSFMYERKVNERDIPSEDVVKGLGQGLAERENVEMYQQVKQQMSDRVEHSMQW
jgi:hypothetical protein